MASLTALDILGIHNLKDYGALPGADILRALTLANDAANGQGVIFVPPGTYTLSADFTPSAGVVILIAGGVTLSGAGVLSAGSGKLIDLNAVQSFSYSLPAGTGGVVAKRFVAGDLTQAAVNSLTVLGLALSTAAEAAAFSMATGGLQAVTADASLALSDYVKVGVGGRATKWNGTQVTIQAAIAGEATAFTQPESATALEIVQASDVAADRGREIVIEGSDGDGVAITETIALDAEDTTTASAGTTEFTKLSAVYTINGEALGAQDVTVRAAGGGATVCTLAGETSELGADVPAESQEAYCNKLTVTGPNGDATYVTIVGIDSADAVARERGTLDGASPSKFTTTTVWRYINRICLGEFTNAGEGAVKTDSTVDVAGRKAGYVVVAAASRGADAVILVKPQV